jgi:hypothetical protein
MPRLALSAASTSYGVHAKGQQIYAFPSGVLINNWWEHRLFQSKTIRAPRLTMTWHGTGSGTRLGIQLFLDIGVKGQWSYVRYLMTTFPLTILLTAGSFDENDRHGISQGAGRSTQFGSLAKQAPILPNAEGWRLLTNGDYCSATLGAATLEPRFPEIRHVILHFGWFQP